MHRQAPCFVFPAAFALAPWAGIILTAGREKPEPFRRFRVANQNYMNSRATRDTVPDFRGERARFEDWYKQKTLGQSFPFLGVSFPSYKVGLGGDPQGLGR